MSPQDQLLVRTVQYVGIGIGMLCLAAAIYVQVWLYQKGKVTAKNLGELLFGITLLIVLMSRDVGPMFSQHSLAVGVVTLMFGTALSVWLVILSYRIISEVLTCGGVVLEYVLLISYLIVLARLALQAPHYIPETGWTQGIAVFGGTLTGLVGAWLQSKPESSTPPVKDAKESVIIRAS